MKYFKSLCLSLCIISITTVFGWGDEGHKLIAEKALHVLPSEMKSFTPWFDYIVTHSVDPDYRKKDDRTEGAKHYIDIDYYKEYNSGNFQQNIDSLAAVYGKDVVKKQGILPWALQNTYRALVEAFRSHNAEKTKVMMADLAHYVGDAHQPMHTTVNYDGQLSGQKGVHARYEIYMVSKHYNELVAKVIPGQVAPVKDVSGSAFDYIYESNLLLPVVMMADTVAANVTNKDYNEEYYRLLWFRTQFVTIGEMTNAAERLASLFYTAWLEAGTPAFELFQ
jgi:hypothetical protein